MRRISMVLTGKQFRDQFLTLLGKKKTDAWGKKHGIDRKVIEKILSGKIPDLPDVVKISRALNTSVDTLLTGVKQESEYSAEERDCIEKVVRVLRSKHEASKASLKNAIHIYYCLICE
jgi:hypothetical protein